MSGNDKAVLYFVVYLQLLASTSTITYAKLIQSKLEMFMQVPGVGHKSLRYTTVPEGDQRLGLIEEPLVDYC